NAAPRQTAASLTLDRQLPSFGVERPASRREHVGDRTLIDGNPSTALKRAEIARRHQGRELSANARHFRNSSGDVKGCLVRARIERRSKAREHVDPDRRLLLRRKRRDAHWK